MIMESVCMALIDALDELVEAGKISHSLARRIIYNYDVSVQDNIGKCGVEIGMKVNICPPSLYMLTRLSDSWNQFF